jgi:DNA repair protein SbcC/Rad50
MIPTRLTLSNFMCYRANGVAAGPPTLDFDGLHVVCLSGENGAGKSALLDALTWALWGEARMADDDLIAQGQAEMSVELEFLLGTQRYRVSRRRQRGGAGKRGGVSAGKSQLDLQVLGESAWRPLAETGVRETQAAINALLRMSYQTFINASFLLQGRADEFTARTPAERKQVLADILDLGEYEALALRARERARSLADQLTGLRGALEQLQRQAAELDTWRALLAQAELTVELQSEACARAEAEQLEAARLLDALALKAEQRKALLRELEQLRAEQARRAAELAALQARITQAETLIARAEAIEAGLAELAAVRTELDRLDQLRDEHTRLTQRQAELRQQFSEAKGELRSRLGALEQRQSQLEQRAARLSQLGTELAGLELQLVALGPLAIERERQTEARQAIERRHDQFAELQRRHDRLESQIKLRQDSLVAVREEQQRSIRELDQQLAAASHWSHQLEAARAAAERLAVAEPELANLRTQEQAAVDELSRQRAESARLKSAMTKLTANQQILAEAGGFCPVCRSELGLDGVTHVQTHYAEELAELRTAAAEAQRQAAAAETCLKQTRSAAADLERQLGALRSQAAQVAPLETQLAQAEGWQRRRAEAEHALVSVQTQLTARAFEPAAQTELAAVAAELATLGDPGELARQRKRIDQQLRELDKQLRERDKLEGQRQARQEELERAEIELRALPELQTQVAALRCTIDTNDFAHAIRSEGQRVGEALAALAYSSEAHAAAREQARALERWTHEAQELRLAEQRLAADRQLYAQSEQLRQRDAATLEQRSRSDALLEQELRDLPRAQARAAELQQTLGAARHRLEAARNDRAEKAAHARRAEDAAAELARRRSEERQLIERQGLFAELSEAFGKKGVQAMLIEQAIPQIEDEANRLLARMTDGQMHMSFEMQRDTKKGDTIETLEIKIADALGTRVYDAFSGGEAMRANFAVRIALSRLLARRAGARLETLVIDEGFGSLDALGRERMVEAITSVQDDFRRIIVITHIDELKDRFPVQIEIAKTALGSHWELR